MRSDAVATIICSQPGIRLQLHYVENIVIHGTTFVGHSLEIEISFVEQFRFENSSFQSSPNGSLTLNHTMNATIIGSSFLKVTQSNCHKAAITIIKSSVLIQYCIFSESQEVINSTQSAITIDSCTFMSNSPTDCDELLYYDTAVITAVNGPQTNENVTITNCDFIDNHRILAKDDKYETNVFVSIHGSALILNNSFVSNTGFKELLHMFTEYGQIDMADNWFSSNTIFNDDYYDAAIQIYASETSITVNNNNFTDNNGIALVVRVFHGTVLVTVSHSNFLGNRQSEDAVGALAIIEGDEYHPDDSSNVPVIITGCTFVSLERAVDIHYMEHGGSVSIVQSTFIDNLSTYYGAAVTIDTHSSVLIDSCTFIENKGLENGAVYIKHASSVFINHSNFLNNQGSDTYSGSTMNLLVHNACIVINESYFYGNRNTRNFNWTDGFLFYHHAGAIDLGGTNNSLIIDKSSFVNNPISVITTWSNGEGDTPSGSIAILRSNFTNNTDQYKGVFLSAYSVEVTETIFFNNSANLCGALSIQALDIHITNSHFVRNSAVYYSGGAMCTFEKFNRMSISNSTFSHNYARVAGGVLRMITFVNVPVIGTIHINNCNFDNNRANVEGGVVWAVPLEALYISNSSFIKNQAGRDGGIAMMSDYYKMNSQLIVSGSSFDQNIANTRGGVFSSLVPCKYLIDNSSFIGNQAETDGGVMYIGSSNSQVRISDGSMFSFNNATERGGVISMNGSRLEISNTTVFNNNFAAIGDDIIACNCNISIPTAFMLQRYTDPSFPNCTLYGHYDVTTADSLPTKSPAGYVVAMAVSIPIAFIVILLLLTATLLGACMCFRRRCLVKQYGVRRSDDLDFVPLMNNT